MVVLLLTCNCLVGWPNTKSLVLFPYWEDCTNDLLGFSRFGACILVSYASTMLRLLWLPSMHTGAAPYFGVVID